MEESTILYLEDEQGNPISFEVIGYFKLGEDAYLAMHQEGNPDPNEIDLTGFHAGPDDEVVLDPIDDPRLYRLVTQRFLDLFDNEVDFPSEPAPQEIAPPLEDDEDFCYQDADGRLFILDQDNNRIYLNEYGEPVEA